MRGGPLPGSSTTLALGLAIAIAAGGAAGCRKGDTLGPPDSFLVYAKTPGPGGPPPEVEPVGVSDERAAPLHKMFAVGFAGEMLRTDYLAKQLVRDAARNPAPGKVAEPGYPAAARAEAQEPTVFVLGDLGAPLGQSIAVKGFFGGPQVRPLPWIALPADPSKDKAFAQTLAGLLARRVVLRVAGADPKAPPPPPVLLEGYARAMEVVAREWRVGQGPEDAMAPDAGTRAQRELFAGVRENQFAVGPDGAPRAASELLADPGVAATVLYRMAQSKSVGRRVAPADVYAPFVTDRIPPGVSPAAVLGPFRNFQAKLLSAWATAVLAGKPPRDIAELVEAYARAMPAERGEALRIFVVTTFGATVKAGGVRSDAAQALPELTALAAELAAGRRTSHDALQPQAIGTLK